MPRYENSEISAIETDPDLSDDQVREILAGRLSVFQSYGYDWAPGEPRVDVDSRESIMHWLEWNARGNGVVSDEASDAEAMPRLTLEIARDSLVESYYQSTGERPVFRF